MTDQRETVKPEILRDNLDKEVTVSSEKSGYQKPWEVIKHKPDEHGFARTEYRLLNPLSNGINSLIFKNPKDRFITSSPATAVINKNVQGVTKYIQDILHIDVPDELTKEDPVWQPLKRDVIEALTVATLYEANGGHKLIDDNEGSVLLFTWLAFRNSDPQIAQSCLSELMNRRKFLLASENKDKPIDKVSLQLGKIPLEKVYTTHATGFLPHIADDKARILPRIDTDGIPRWTIHTYVNGMVEEHGIGGLLKNSWENQKYLFGMKFQDVVSSNGLPSNFFKADTFWSLEPGKGLVIPNGSFIVVPDDEVAKMDVYKKLGLEIVSYNPAKETLRDASKRYLTEHDIPFIENINAKDPDNEDALFAGEIGVQAITHFNFRKYNDAEHMMITAVNVIVNGEKYIAESGFLSFEEANLISLLANQGVSCQYKPKKHALSLSIQNTRQAILESYFSKKVPNEALITAFTAGLL